MGEGAASRREECVRCGRFSPAAELDAQRVCDDCFSRLSELERVPPSIANVLVGATKILMKVGLPALVLVVATALPLYFLRAHGTYVPFVGWVLDVLVQTVLLTLAHRAIQGRRVDLTTSVQASTDHLVRMLVVALVAHLQIFFIYLAPTIAVGLLVFQTPELAGWLFVPAQLLGLGLALWRATTLALAMPIALHEQKSGRTALAASTRVTKGHRLPSFLFALTGLVWLMVPIVHWLLTFVLDLVASMTDVVDPALAADIAAQMATLGPALEIAHLAVAAIAMLFMTSISAVLYAKTVRYRIY